MGSIYGKVGYILNKSGLKQYVYVNLGGCLAKAPVLGIRITRSADYTIHKTLSGDFKMLVFLTQPVIITIAGLTAVLDLRKCSEEGTSSSQNSQKPTTLLLFVKKYRMDPATLTELFNLTVDKTGYKVCLISVLLDAILTQAYPGILNYTMTFYGTQVP